MDNTCRLSHIQYIDGNRKLPKGARLAQIHGHVFKTKKLLLFEVQFSSVPGEVVFKTDANQFVQVTLLTNRTQRALARAMHYTGKLI